MTIEQRKHYLFFLFLDYDLFSRNLFPVNQWHTLLIYVIAQFIIDTSPNLIASEVLESAILVKCEEYLCTSDNQFGFTSGNCMKFDINTLNSVLTPQFL